MIMKPHGDCPEGELLRFLFKEFKSGSVTQSFTNTQVNELIAKIDALSGKSDESVFSRIVEYVNTNYGIVSVRENKQYQKLIDDIQSNKDGFSVDEVYDRLKGIPEPEESSTMLRVAEDETDPVPYIDTQRVKEYLDVKIQKFTEILKTHHFQDFDKFQKNTYTLSRMFRNIRLEFKNQTRDQKVNKLRHLINGQVQGFRGDMAAPMQIHERVAFVLDIIKQLKQVAVLYTELPKQANTGSDVERVLMRA